MHCQYVSASEAGDELFQVIFEEKREQEHGPYLLISRAFLDEDEGEPSTIYIETLNEDLIGHYSTVGADLRRDQLTLTLPAPANETIEVYFKTPQAEFRQIVRTLGIILQQKLIIKEDCQQETGVRETRGRAIEAERIGKRCFLRAVRRVRHVPRPLAPTVG